MIKKSRVFWIAIVVLAIFFSPGCSKKKSTKPEPSEDKWTILGYFDGNNEEDADPETNGSYVIQDVQEMEQIGSTENVQIIVMLGSIKTEGNCNYYLIEKHLNEPAGSISSKVLESLDKKDMSDPQTLTSFIQYGMEHYPADHYMLIINDHGSGWRGVCSDQQNGGGRMMSLSEVSSALYGYKFEIILFNAPSMSMLEVAYQLKDKANYLVASQFKLPMQNILGSSEWLPTLTGNPDISSISLAHNIVDEVYNAASNKGKYVHIAAINLTKVDALASKVADLGNSLRMRAGAYWNEVFDAYISACKPVDEDSAFADLRAFAQGINVSSDLDSAIKNDAQKVVNSTNEAVTKSLNNPPYYQGGLSIHFPWNSDLFDSTDYAQLNFTISDSSWCVFLSHFILSTKNCLGGLDIRSTPDGADIFINGQYTGRQTNAIIDGLLPGTYYVKVVKPGYPEKGSFKTVESGKIVFLAFNLYGGPGPSSPRHQAHSNLTFEQ
jgi:hypothetical protein